MKVLQICSKPPQPSLDGGCKAINVITQGLLNQGLTVKVLAISTIKHPFQKNKISENYLRKTAIESVFVDTRVKPFAAFSNFFTSQSYNITRFYDAQFEQLIQQALAKENFDIVLLEGLYVTPYINVIRKHTAAKIIYRAHNVEFEIWQRNSDAADGLKKVYLNSLAKKLKKYEVAVLNKIDGIAAITSKDKDQLLALGCKKAIEIIPFGIELEAYQDAAVQHKDSLFHIGSMDWMPNQEAMKWFLEQVWVKVVNRFPEEKFYLAGRNMPDWLLNKKQQNLIVVGEVGNAVDFINEHEIMVVPLFAGSGMRIKIIEGMALGKTIIATSLAAEGINCQTNENILIANTPKEFIAAIALCIEDKSITKKIGENAKKLVASNYDNKVIVNNLVQFFKHIL